MKYHLYVDRTLTGSLNFSFLLSQTAGSLTEEVRHWALKKQQQNNNNKNKNSQAMTKKTVTTYEHVDEWRTLPKILFNFHLPVHLFAYLIV